MKEALRSMTEDMMAMIRRKDFAPFNLALSGGETAKHMFSLWVDEYKDKIDWNNIRFFWVDERCVGPEHPESNYGLARRELLGQVPATHFFRMRGEADPVEAAVKYEQQIRHDFNLGPQELPRFDFMLLGMGEDGHTGSIFPNSAAQIGRAHA